MDNDLSRLGEVAEKFSLILTETLSHVCSGASFDIENTQDWNDDTRSLADSFFGYGAYGNSEDSTYRLNDAIEFGSGWRRAMSMGSDKYKQNTPEHYIPTVHDEDFPNPTGVITFGVGYPEGGNIDDDELYAQVENSLIRAMYEAAGNIQREFEEQIELRLPRFYDNSSAGIKSHTSLYNIGVFMGKI